MRKQKGIATLPLVVLVAVLGSGGVAGTSVAIANSPDVLPDSSAYGLKTAGQMILCRVAEDPTQCRIDFLDQRKIEIEQIRGDVTPEKVDELLQMEAKDRADLIGGLDKLPPSSLNCELQGKAFNECGSNCAEGEICATVCVPVCE